MKMLRVQTKDSSTRRKPATLALALLLAASVFFAGCSKKSEIDPSITVGEGDVTLITKLAEKPQQLHLSATYSLPPNSFVDIDSDTVAAVRNKTGLPHPLAEAGTMNLASGTYTKLLPQGAGHNEGYDITDVRATDTMLLWVEVKETTQEWRLYRAPLVASSGSLGKPHILATGDKTRQIPAIAAVGATAIWTDALKTELREGGETSHVYKSDSDETGKKALFTTTNPILVAPQRSGNILTVADWALAGAGSRRSDLHAIDIATAKEVATLHLPSPISVSDAIYFEGSGFSFSVPALYTGVGPLGNVGTYVQTGEKTFTRFPKTPLDTPSKSGEDFVVKNGASVIFYLASAKAYRVIEPPQNAPDYGDYIATHGSYPRIVLFTQGVNEDGSSAATAVRIFTP